MKRAALLSILVLTGLCLVPAAVAAQENHPCFFSVDANGDGQVDQTEFLATYGPDATERFGKIDADKNGNLSHEEYEAGMP